MILTRYQKIMLAAFIFLMAADFAISSYGVLFLPGFTEANALFARFMTYPLTFITVVGVTKIIVIAGLIAATVWFNRREREDNFWHGGNLLCSTAAVGMGVMMLVLIIANLIFI
ncbi:MAG TPA: hypothetical protein PLV88_01280 [Methanoregulaceae archaeon]|jgi:glucan phosphoethanolaminetransferase (alkaline phosphatase superfamily)|nr:hypothetical protein [Burkholderiaceae bacterium]NLH25272.1 hypothetical protein [Methanomicrobiales archaeon]HMZ32049.1 hypothetical protein [Methanoregulaceae archaeon]HNB02898.1 hypothetical protein [Methanoregulaceae archaeon]HNI42350.1 hypothetical protein [Methanoregulaceae archaeon]